MKTLNQTSLIRLDKGSKVVNERGEQGTILDMTLVPNGRNEPNLVVILYVQYEDGRVGSATSNRFKPLNEEPYEEFYPSVHLNQLT